MDMEQLKAAVTEALEITVELEPRLKGLDQDRAAMVRHALWRAADELGILYTPEAPPYTTR